LFGQKAQRSRLEVLTQRTKEKPSGSLAFGSPRETLYRDGGKNSLRSNNSRLIPLSSASLGCAAMGLKP
jgi:hypothetical protein